MATAIDQKSNVNPYFSPKEELQKSIMTASVMLIAKVVLKLLVPGLFNKDFQIILNILSPMVTVIYLLGILTFRSAIIPDNQYQLGNTLSDKLLSGAALVISAIAFPVIFFEPV